MDGTKPTNPLVDQLAKQYIEASQIESMAMLTGSRGYSIIANMKRSRVERTADAEGIGKEVRNRARELVGLPGREE